MDGGCKLILLSIDSSYSRDSLTARRQETVCPCTALQKSSERKKSSMTFGIVTMLKVKYDVRNCHNAVANFLDKVTEALILKGKPDKVEGSGMLYTV